ncbi:MAG: hypothetical protein H0U73_00650 [Tatlockia sp.]|nr:hypothetical protein [Tatlockia sp.]
MAYNLVEVAQYAFEIAHALKNYESVSLPCTWEEHRNVTKQMAENSKWSSKDEKTIGGYARVLHYAAKFLYQSHNKVNYLQQQFIDLHLEGLKKAYQQKSLTVRFRRQ